MSSIISRVVSLLISLWVAKVFLLSLPYKFTNHPDTQHIFSTIGQWMSDTIATGLGEFFSNYGAYLVGSVELIASSILLIATINWLLVAVNVIKGSSFYRRWYLVGGLLSSVIMSGAAFFHLVTPLGVEVLHQGKSDGGSLFYAAVSILLLGLLLAFINRAPQSVQQ